MFDGTADDGADSVFHDDVKTNHTQDVDESVSSRVARSGDTVNFCRTDEVRIVTCSACLQTGASGMSIIRICS